MTIRERQPNHWLGLVKGQVSTLTPGDTRYVLTDPWANKIRELKIIDDDAIAVYDIKGTRLISTNDNGGVRPVYDWFWRKIERACINFKTISGSTIFWEK